MGYVKIKVLEKGSAEDLKRWKDHMMEEPKCWNKFCYGCYEQEDLHAFHVTKVDNNSNLYITTLCNDCVAEISNNDILVNESHLMVESLAHHK